MKIGQVSEVSGLPAKTIRYYESIGLIEPAGRTSSGYRAYQEKDIETLKFIQRARSLGFSISEVSALLTLWNDRNRASSQVKALAKQHVADMDRKITELQSMKDTLSNLIEKCQGDHRPDCPILNDFAQKDR
ncbi:MerR family transcriptional regulator [Kiloniella litopenaei]|uniref:MerR family transcriptional regulator n=1 Tax=Kiloniella litopenaei TaxID=1549748 RepID=A0A0M2R7N1_9PROT|nr:Cu(I)-responsive transcriptional regulator [Kiloniella litopenaei]KKJ75528.1 MerR family transcriptional regulator [Kiloniella litopenaei]